MLPLDIEAKFALPLCVYALRVPPSTGDSQMVKLNPKSVELRNGGGGRLLDPNYFQNGLPMVTDFHGGAENFRSIDYMAIPFPPMQTLATMIFECRSRRLQKEAVGSPSSSAPE